MKVRTLPPLAMIILSATMILTPESHAYPFAAPSRRRNKMSSVPSQPEALLSRRVRQDYQIMKQRMEEMSTPQMVAMTSVGTAILLLIVLVLATSNNGGMISEADIDVSTSVEMIVENVVDAAIPGSATDALSVALGEGLAGILSAVFTYGLGELRMLGMMMPPSIAINTVTDDSKETKFKNDLEMSLERQKQGLPTLSDALADGDFLLTQAAATPLLLAGGATPVVATVIGLAVAVVPSEFIRLQARSRLLRTQEDALMDELLLQQQREERRRWQRSNNSGNAPSAMVNPESLKPILYDENNSAGGWKNTVVEIFCDVARWLEYQVLIREYRGSIAPILLANNALESAAFGALATLSTLLYADVAHLYFGLGGSTMRQTVQERTISEWSAIYLTRMFYGAVLFGVYQGAQGPATELVSDLLSGGVDSCVGSIDFDLCLETYVEDNPLGTSPQSQLQALVTDLNALWARLLS